MVGMAVGNPHILALLGRLHLFFRNLVGQRPTSEVGVAFQPGVGDEHRPSVVANDRGIANCLESYIHLMPFPAQRNQAGRRNPHLEVKILGFGKTSFQCCICQSLDTV